MIDPVAAQRASVVELADSMRKGSGFSPYPAAGMSTSRSDSVRRGASRAQAPLVRQALAYGIDRVAIARAIGTPLEDARPTEPFDSVVFPARALLPAELEGYRYRPAHARRLLEQAGCRRGQDRIYSCDGERLELRFLAPSNVECRRRTVELVQAQLRQVGVEIRPEYAPPSILFGQILANGDFDLMLFGSGWAQARRGP